MTGQYIHPGDKLEGEQGTGLDEFMNASSKVLAKVEGIAEALNNVLAILKYSGRCVTGLSMPVISVII